MSQYQFKLENPAHLRTALDYIPVRGRNFLPILSAIKNRYSEDGADIAKDWLKAETQQSPDKVNKAWREAGKGSGASLGLAVIAKRLKDLGVYDKCVEQCKRVGNAGYVPPTPQEHAAREAANLKAQAEREAEEAEKAAQAKQVLAELIPTLSLATSHLYLERKQADGRGAYVLGETKYDIYPLNQIGGDGVGLLIPLQNSDGEIVTAQIIWGDKKRTLSGATTKECFAWVGAKPTHGGAVVYIGEGYATVNSALQAVPDAFGVMAIDANNLPSVAAIIAKQYPDAAIVILADNDALHAGETKAKQACDAVPRACYRMPADVGMDWNDVHVKYGLDAVHRGLSVPPKSTGGDPLFSSTYAIRTPVRTPSEKAYPLNVPPTKKSTPERTPSCITVNKRYLGGLIAQAFDTLETRFLVVRSPLGTGKTTAIKKMIQQAGDGNVLVITSRETLNRAVAEELGLAFYKDVLSEKDRNTRKEMAKRMAITPNSLPQILREFPDIVYALLVIDESETAASMLVSEATSEKTDTLKALMTAAGLAHKNVLMDAFAGSRTDKLIEILADGQKVGRLVNESTPWDDHTLNVVTSFAKKGKKADEKRALKSLIMQSIRAGLKPYIASSSKAFCEEIDAEIKKQFPDLPTALVTADTKYKQGVVDLMRDTSNATLYAVLIGSPAISVGLSIDVEHFDAAYGYFGENTKHTPDPWDALQSLARARKLKSKQWFVVLPQNTPFANPPATPQDIQDALDLRNKLNIAKAARPVGVGDSVEGKLIDLYTVCEHSRYHSKNNYTPEFMREIKAMGLTVSTIDAASVVTSDAESDASEFAKKAKQVKKKTQDYAGVALNDGNIDAAMDALDSKPRHVTDFKALADAGIIPIGGKQLTEAEYEQVKFEKKKTPERANPEHVAAMKRYQLEKKYAVDMGELSEDKAAFDELEKLVALDAVACCIRREKAEAPKDFHKRYTTGLLVGLDDEGSFKADITSDKMNHNIVVAMYRYALPYLDSKPFSNAQLKKEARGCISWFTRNEKTINALQIKALPRQWKKKPALLMKSLLLDLGMATKRMTKGKRNEGYYSVDTKKNAPLIAYYEKRQALGMNWVLGTSAIMAKYAGVVGYVLTDADVIEYNLNDRDISLLADVLAVVPPIRHKELTGQWLWLKRSKNPLIANKALAEEAQKINPAFAHYSLETRF